MSLDAMKLALEALEFLALETFVDLDKPFNVGPTRGREAITALRAAIEQPRQWQGLTDEERGQVINANFGTGLWQMAKDIEAKLKEKNT
jgi:hypothetical protein